MFAAVGLLLLYRVTGSVVQIPVSEPICIGQQDTGPGGMFGYSVALSSGEGEISWLAIGKPWDATVHLYYASNPDLSMFEEGANQTYSNYTFEETSWTPAGMLADTNNGTFPTTAISLFGYTVSFTEDGEWLAVGIPARPRNLNPTALEDKTFVGEVRLYRQQLSRTFTLVGIQRNPTPGNQFWSKFGSKLKFQTLGNATYLIVSANHGWDGASVNYKGARPGSPNWPIQPVSNVDKAGLYVFKLLDPDARYSSVRPISELLEYTQFIKQKSTVPMGSLGIDFSVGKTATDGLEKLHIFMRDYYVFPGLMNEASLKSECPGLNCSYVTFNVGGVQQTVAAAGCVVEYVLEPESLEFREVTTVSHVNFTLPENIRVNQGYSLNSWENLDWFGIGIDFAFDEVYNRHVLAVGAPKDATGVYSFFKRPPDYYDGQEGGITNQWTSGAFVVNQAPFRQSSFGQRVALSPDARFLVVANPSGSGMSKGRGEVFIYYRYSDIENIYPAQYTIRTRTSPTYPRGTLPPPFNFQAMSQLAGDKAESVNNYTSFRTDHFGVGLDINRFFIAVGAPVKDCVYIYRFPIAKPFAKPPKPRPPVLPSYTIQPPAVTEIPADSNDSSQGQTPSQAWMYGVIAGIVALLLIAPVAAWIIWKRHKQQVMRSLAEGHGKEKVGMSEESLAITEFASEPNLTSTETLNTQ